MGGGGRGVVSHRLKVVASALIPMVELIDSA